MSEVGWEMVTIANPIYDTVFKHLMENQVVARGLISSLLDLEITEIQLRPQEVTDVHYATPLSLLDDNLNLRIFRLDFTAVVKLKQGGTRKVIIELQKAGKSEALLRFRGYLGRTYQSREKDDKGRPLPIIAIYLLGFLASPERPALILSRNGLFNGITSEPLPALKDAEDDHFFQALTHDCAYVQIPRIKDLTGDSEVELALRMFNQSYVKENRHFLILAEEHIQSGPPWLRQAFRMLQTAVADEEVQKAMAVEDQLAEILEDLEKQSQQLQKERDEERRLKEEALSKSDEERRLKEEERRLKEEERRLKEEERRLKEEERRLKEEALSKTEVERSLKEAAMAKAVGWVMCENPCCSPMRRFQCPTSGARQKSN
jgi:rubrerythrin